MRKKKKANVFQKQIGGDHYREMEIQPIEFIYHNQIPAIEARAINYIVRHSSKNGEEDIHKAIHMLEMLLALEYNG